MTYVIPTAMKCLVCGYTGHAQVRTARTISCPQCFDEFIRKNVPTLVPDPDGKPFDPNSLIVNL
ncbi:hypothetical protein [Pseudomonas simiae]|jgi:predicted Zn-ribbon and HTH transcriptional regulator|uniref:hypothetical protein n=1 Tax=Pseudomonas simiae TaxID=321846 RepID=UPI002735AF4C|nr:hypothetical protein [Pseudomonas simiae]WLG72217.1 hypothetical protein PSH60_18845 [Pseudomonas simiae]